MGLAFANDIAGGITLVRPALRSPNYVAGSTGWTVNADGTAEFSGAVIRGDFSAGGVAPNAHVEIVGQSGIPPDLQAFYGGTLRTATLWWFNGTDYHYSALSNADSLYYGVVSGLTTIRQLYRIVGNVANAYRFDGPNSAIAFDDNGDALVYGDGAGQLLTSASAGFNVVTLTITDPALLINGVDVGRGLTDWQGSTGSTAAIGAETVVMTSSVVDWVSGRAYKVTWGARLTASAAQSTTVFIRTGTTTAGAILSSWQQTVVAGGLTNNREHTTYIRRTGATLNSAICLTYAASAGTVTGTGAANTIRYLKIEDVGLYADYPNAIAI